MCVIVYQPPNETIDKELAESLWKRNSDGGGIAFFNGRDEIEIHKAMNFTSWWAQYTNYTRAYPDSPFVLHMRIATHGSVSLDNNHPFRVDDHTVMAHNGIIHATTPYSKDDDRSDTRVFIDEVLPHLPANWLEMPYLADMVSAGIGSSKLVFLTNNPALSRRAYIVNKSKGEMFGNFWFSNTYGMQGTAFYKKYRPNVYTFTSSPSITKGNKKKDKSTNNTNGKYRYVPAKRKDDKKHNEINQDLTWAELSKLAEPIQEERIKQGFVHHVRANVIMQMVYCIGCGSQVTLEDIECECYDMSCGGCLDFLAFCECDYPTPLPLEDGEIPPRALYYEMKKKGELDGPNDTPFEIWMDKLMAEI